MAKGKIKFEEVEDLLFTTLELDREASFLVKEVATIVGRSAQRRVCDLELARSQARLIETKARNVITLIDEKLQGRRRRKGKGQD